MKVSREEQRRLNEADQADQEYEEELQKKIDELPSTWSRLYAMLRPQWALWAGILFTVILSPSTIVQSYLMLDRIILLLMPLDSLPVIDGKCTPV